jgi:hypothetical protein
MIYLFLLFEKKITIYNYKFQKSKKKKLIIALKMQIFIILKN